MLKSIIQLLTQKGLMSQVLESTDAMLEKAERVTRAALAALLEKTPPGFDIYALDREQKILPQINRKLPLLEDWVCVLSPDGDILRRVSLVECFMNSEYRGVLDFIPVGADIFHTNSIKVLDDTLKECRGLAD